MTAAVAAHAAEGITDVVITAAAQDICRRGIARHCPQQQKQGLGLDHRRIPQAPQALMTSFAVRTTLAE